MPNAETVALAASTYAIVMLGLGLLVVGVRATTAERRRIRTRKPAIVSVYQNWKVSNRYITSTSYYTVRRWNDLIKDPYDKKENG